MYKITAYGFWTMPKETWVETKEEADELAKELKSLHFSVEIEYIEEG